MARFGKLKWQKLLEKHYHTPGQEGAFSSAAKLRDMLLDVYKLKVSERDVQKWLEAQFTYTIHRSRFKTFKRNQIIVPEIAHTLQADIGFLDRYAKDNDGATCFLAVIDALSRYGYCEALKNKSGPEVAKGMTSILDRLRTKFPEKLHTDQGTEFYNSQFKRTLKRYGIDLYSSFSDKKAAIAERFIKTIKEKIKKYMDDNATHRWVDVLDDLVASYNVTKHKSIGMRPADVNEKNEGKILRRLYGHLWARDNVDDFKLMKKHRTPKFKPGDTVKLSGVKHAFAKGYEGYWTDEVFKIKKVWYSVPFLMYTVTEWQTGDEIKGRFYEQELSPVDVKGKTWRVEKILKKEYRNKKLWFLVKFQNYAKPEWIPSENLTGSAKGAF